MQEREKYVLLKGMDAALVKFLTGKNCFVAGGAITSIFSGARINDYDIYFETEEDKLFVLRWFAENSANANKGDWYIKFKSDTAITYKKKEEKQIYQLIVMPEMIGTPETIVGKFDFTICMGWYSFKTDEFGFGKDFSLHLGQRRLVFNINCEYPLCALFRTRKFLGRGFTISGSEIIKLGLSVHRLKLDTYKDLRRQLLGIDTLFLKDLTDSLDLKEQAEKQYAFDKFMEMIDEYINKYYSKLFDLDGEVENAN